jgi:hypothetical protein
MSAIRKDVQTGAWMVQCESCLALVPVTVSEWTGDAPLPAHPTWRQSWMHRLAEGHVDRLHRRWWCRLITLAERWLRPAATTCVHPQQRDYRQEWASSGFASYGPT